MQWQRIVFRPETAHYSSPVKNKQQQAPQIDDRIVDHCRCDRDRTVYRSTLLPARPRPINKDRFTRIFLSDAVTTEFPSPGDDRIQFHAVSLLEASIFTKAVSQHQQRVQLLTPFGVVHPLPYHQEIVRQKQDSKHTHTTYQKAHRKSSITESNLVFGQVQKWCGGKKGGSA